MNPLNIIRGFDHELYDYFEKELEHQHYSLSFIPDENPISPLCSAMMGNVLVNSYHNTAFSVNTDLAKITKNRICKLFKGENANVSTITIETASRVVFQAVTQRGDVVMSLDLRKKEHCNSESFVYQFVNFGIDPNTQELDYDAIEKSVLFNKPRLIILSPINLPRTIDYERVSKMAKEVGAILWCDISQVAGLIMSGVLPSPLPHADIVTFTTHGALQGPSCSIIISNNRLASAIDRACISSGHSGLNSSELAALTARLEEMATPEYTSYCKAVVDNAKALAKGLQDGGCKLVCNGTESHLVIIDSRHCAIAARGALESLADCGVNVRICQVLTSDPNTKFDAVRLSTLPATTRGVSSEEMEKIGFAIGKFLVNPDPKNEEHLRSLVRETTLIMPIFNVQWLCDTVKANLVEANYLNSESESSTLHDSAHINRIGQMLSAVGHKLHKK